MRVCYLKLRQFFGRTSLEVRQDVYRFMRTSQVLQLFLFFIFSQFLLPIWSFDNSGLEGANSYKLKRSIEEWPTLD